MDLDSMATSTRRQPVAQGGGLFSTPKPSFSKETQDLLKLMMQESKLTNFQQRKLRESMMDGQALPANCPPTSSSPGASGRAARASGKKTTPRSAQGCLRSKEMIQKLAANDSGSSYRPPPNSKTVGECVGR
ncbi:UPF0193 protein EVG1 [Geodia barretti]|uniref:UPF0193 protein EVG1 n=1 Tax=Geodia barretti TaxID=519541 RepID=A0AA35TG61_GEOBA|nr:UPF0193 protein EVG1 [Geodia barretti]